MKECMWTEREKDREFIHSQMGDNMMVDGKMEKSMVKEMSILEDI